MDASPVSLPNEKESGDTISPGQTYSLLLVLSVIWGMAFVAIRYVEPALYAVNLTLQRWVLSSAGLLVLLPFFGRSVTKFELRNLPRFMLASFANDVA